MADKYPLEPLRGSRLPAVPDAKPVVGEIADPEIEISVLLRRNPDGGPIPDFATDGFAPEDRRAFAERWGARRSDVEALMEYLEYVDSRIEGLEDTPDAPRQARRLIGIKGPLSSLASAFGTSVQLAQLDSGEHVLLRSGHLSAPSGLLGIVEGVFGLDTRPIGARGKLPPDVCPGGGCREVTDASDAGGALSISRGVCRWASDRADAVRRRLLQGSHRPLL